MVRPLVVGFPVVTMMTVVMVMVSVMATIVSCYKVSRVLELGLLCCRKSCHKRDGGRNDQLWRQKLHLWCLSLSSNKQGRKGSLYGCVCVYVTVCEKELLLQ
jgi:hypothetical protein